MADTRVEIKSVDEHTITIGGYGVVFGGADLAGEQFAPTTDFWFDKLPGARPVLYDHGLDPLLQKSVLGSAVKIVPDDVGLWVEAQLQRNHQYIDYVLDLIRAGALGYSSGALGHLIERESHGDITLIKSWPIGEFSLTPTPAEPRTLGVAELRSVPGLPAELLKTVPEAACDAAAPATIGEPDQAESTHDISTTTTEVSMNMTEFDFDALAAKLAQHLRPATTDAGLLPPTDTAEATSAAEQQIKSFNLYLRTGQKAALQVATPAEGGYLVPQLYSNELVTAISESSVLRMAGARVLAVDGTTAFNVPTMNPSGAAVLTAEEAAYNEAEPDFGNVAFTPYKFTRLVKASEELVLDSRFDLMSQILLPDVAQAFAAAENAAFATGNGATAPQGIVTGGTVGVTTAAPTAITADEIISLYHALSYVYRQNAVWLMNDATAAAIRKLKDTTGQYLWQPGLQAGQPDRLLGRPVYTLNTMPTIAATAKTIVFGDLRYFWIVDFAGTSMQRLSELYAATGQIGFRWFRRFDSNVMLPQAIQILQMHA